VVLRCYDDLPVAQVASELGIAEGTVKPYLSEAMTRLAARLSPAERGWGGVNRWALTKTNCGSA
jgi:DNA-directed RNA polymerase specialized sigma24 family protein